MRRAVVAAVVVLLLVGAITWFMRDRTRETAAVAEGLIVALRVDGAFETTIERGEPLLLEVFLQGRTDTASGTFGSAATPWPRLVTLRCDPDVALGDVSMLGAPRMTGVVLKGGKPSLLTGEDPAIARIDGRQRTYSVLLGIPSERTSTLPTGRRTITATVGGVASLPVSVTVTEPTAAREVERLRRSARFAVRAGKYEAGKRIAEDVLARQPDDVAGHTTIGDALSGLGRPVEARAAYLKALGAIRSGRQFYEEPASIVDRIRRVEGELAARRR